MLPTPPQLHCILLLVIFTEFFNNSQSIQIERHASNSTSVLSDPLNAFKSRQKRYLLFEETAVAVFTGNVGKALIDGFPRGLNVLFEYALVYDLPTKLSDLYRTRKKQPQKTETKTKTTQNSTATIRKAWSTYSSNPYKAWSYNKQHTNERRKYKWPQMKWYKGEHGKQSANKCINNNLYKDYYQRNYEDAKKWCRPPFKSHRRLRSVLEPQTFSESLLFDLLGKLAEFQGLNARHCVMRTLCESKFMLMPRGYSLFHDMLHVLISNSMSALQRYKPYRDALWQPSINQCSVLYGPHCPVSFLQHFNSKLHGGVLGTK